MKDMTNQEPFVNSTQAAQALNISKHYVWAVRKALAAEGKPLGRVFLASDIRNFLLANPRFNSKKAQSDRSLLLEALQCLQGPRSGQRPLLIAKLKKRLRVDDENEKREG